MRVNIFKVDATMNVKAFLNKIEKPYVKGAIFYQLTKKETISDIKNVIVRRKSDNVLITGEGIRDILGLSSETVVYNLDNSEVLDFDIFIQSTSPLRKLIEGTDVLYTSDGEGSVLVYENSIKPSIVSPSIVSPSIVSPSIVVPQEIIINDGPKPVEVVITFDTTGSMYPCLTQVRNNVRTMIKNLFEMIPGIRIGIIAHGDYGDSYVTQQVDLSVDQDKLCKFVEKVEGTGGSDWEECYELVLRESYTKISWSSVAKKVIMMIGDAIPHAPNSNRNIPKIDWRVEAKNILDRGINFYAIQALGNKEAGDKFWKPLAHETNGIHLDLSQFSHTKEYIMAICFHSNSNVQLENYMNEIQKEGKINRSLHNMFSKLLGKNDSFSEIKNSDLEPVMPSRFQVLEVGDNNITIKQFALDNGLVFKVGRGFYEFTKPEIITDKKEIVLMDKNSGDMFTGDEAKKLVGISEKSRIKPGAFDKWRVFVQSTSATRVLVAKTGFLYEVV